MSVIVMAVASLAASGCTGKRAAIGPAYASQGAYQGWSCNQLSLTVALDDATLTTRQKNAIEQAMITKGCIHPLAAETE